jgi:hypothetical protein
MQNMTHIDILRKHLKSPEAVAAYVNEALSCESVEYAQVALRQLNKAIEIIFTAPKNPEWVT